MSIHLQSKTHSLQLAWAEGQSAAYLGRPARNPYDDDTDENLEWQNGYEMASPHSGRPLFRAPSEPISLEC